MKTTILIALSAYVLTIVTGHAATFTCTFMKDKKVVGKCPIDTANPNKTCETQFSNTLQGSCIGNNLGTTIFVVSCAFHDPKLKATDAVQMVRDDQESAKLATPAGFVSGGSTITDGVRGFSIGYVEKSGSSQFKAECLP